MNLDEKKLWMEVVIAAIRAGRSNEFTLADNAVRRLRLAMLESSPR